VSRGPAGILWGLDRAAEWALRWGSISCLVALLALVGAGVFVRFVPVASMGWADEIVELAFAWMVFLGATALWRDGSHFRVEALPLIFRSPRLHRGLTFFGQLISLAFLLLFTYQAGLLARDATDRSPILEWPRVVFYGVMPASGGLMIFYSLRDLWRGLRTGPPIKNAAGSRP
jgi:TRAP-type C4-dicarboxylate transport system permease small subunit